MGRAFSEVISSELAGAPDVYLVGPNRIRTVDRTLGSRPISAPGVSTEEPDAIGAGANRVGYGTYWMANGRLQARLVIQDTARMNDVREYAASAAAGDLLGAASALAHQISNRAGRYGTANEQAAMAYAKAIEAPDAAAAEAQASIAMNADPQFARPYAVLAELKAGQDPAGAQSLLEQALARPGILPSGRARLQIEDARLRNQPAALERALADLARLEPGDADNWRALAEAAFARHDFRQALTAWQKVLAIVPGDVNGLNQLAYSAAYTGDISTATASLRRYQALQPGDANALDSLGDINLITGHLKEAEEFYVQAVKKNPNFYAGADWFKAAMARLMTGDVAGADALAKQFTDARSAAHDASVPILQAEWQWLSGRRKEAYSALEKVAQASSPLSSVAYTQLSVWSLMQGDRNTAEQMSTKAMALANRGPSVEAVVARFLAQPPATAAEWQARAGRLMPNPAQQNIRDGVLAYALLFSREFAPAADVLQRLYETTPPTSGNEGLPVLLAWAYLETGRDNDAAPLLALNPVPPITGPSVFTGMYFPRIFELRARLEQKHGQAQPAQANLAIFTKLTGTDTSGESKTVPAIR